MLKDLVVRMLSVEPGNRPGMAEVDQIACRQYLHIVRHCPFAVQPSAAHAHGTKRAFVARSHTHTATGRACGWWPQLDQEGDVTLGGNPSALEALAQQIIPRPTQPRTQAEDAMDIAAGLPTGLPVISEMLPTPDRKSVV